MASHKDCDTSKILYGEIEQKKDKREDARENICTFLYPFSHMNLIQVRITFRQKYEWPIIIGKKREIEKIQGKGERREEARDNE